MRTLWQIRRAQKAMQLACAQWLGFRVDTLKSISVACDADGNPIEATVRIRIQPHGNVAEFFREYLNRYCSSNGTKPPRVPHAGDVPPLMGSAGSNPGR